MKAPVWVRCETVLAVHEQLLALYGGAAGLRDVGLFDSALARPKNLCASGTPTVFALAGSYANKRIGFAVAALFLQLNGWRLEAGQADAVVQTLGLAAGAIGEADYATWLTANSRQRI